MSDQIPKIEPIKVKQYEVKQSKYNQVARIPTSKILLGPSHSGKGVLLSNMILDIYRNCFERVYIFSPSINVDHTWLPVKKYISDKIMKSDDEPEFYYDTYDPDSLDKIMDNQKKIVEYQKNKKIQKMYFKY